MVSVGRWVAVVALCLVVTGCSAGGDRPAAQRGVEAAPVALRDDAGLVRVPRVEQLRGLGPALRLLRDAGFRVRIHEAACAQPAGCRHDVLGTRPSAGTPTAVGRTVTLDVHSALADLSCCYAGPPR